MKIKKSLLIATSLMFSSISMGANIEALKKEIKTEPVLQLDIPIEQHIKHSFDVSDKRGFYTVLRFIDMNLEAGVDPDMINVAMVVHGKATMELLKESNNHYLDLILESDLVDVIVCGQNISKRNFKKDDLKNDVKIALSAMNAHNYLQSKGYTYNPF